MSKVAKGKHEDYVELILVVSLGHISKEDLENMWANQYVSRYGNHGEYGFISILGNGASEAFKKQGYVSEAFVNMIRKLEELYPGVPRVQFDRDGLEHPELPLYEW